MSNRQYLREAADLLVGEALKEDQCELLIRHMAESFIDALAERGEKGRHEVRHLTDICLLHERSNSN